MQERTDISIITVTYNCEATIERTLRSIESQSSTAFEHIIIDGASTDGTMRLVDAYKARNPHLHITAQSEPDHGLYDAMNKGIRRARGSFIVFLNAGDKLHSDDVLQRIAAHDAQKVGVVYGETDLVDDEGRFLRHRRLSVPERLTSRSFLRGMLVCHQSFYANRRLVQPYDLQYRYSADVDWCIRVMKACEAEGMEMVNVHAVLTDYLSEGMTTQHQRASLLERFRVMRSHYGLCATLGAHLYIIGRSLFLK